MLFKQVTLYLVSLMRGFCPEMDCLEEIMYGGGFLDGGFVRAPSVSTLSPYGLTGVGMNEGGGK